MLKIHPLIFLFLLQFLLIFFVLATLLFIRNRKLAVKGSVKMENDDVSKWKAVVQDMRNRFETLRSANVKLKEAIARLIPEAERSKEYEELLSDIEMANKDLDTCVGTLENKNRDLEKRAVSMKREAEGLSELLQKSVRREELEVALSQKKDLEMKVDRLEKELEQKRDEHNTLSKQFEWLKKEYNALYREETEEESKAES